jgi:hypothetical protein
MSWSFSAHSSFRKCPRQWFYKQYVANHKSKDPLRREAYRLSKLETVFAWRGKIVDDTISDLIVPSVRYRAATLREATAYADQLFSQRQRTTTFNTPDGKQPEQEAFNAARNDIHIALENLYKQEHVRRIVRSALQLIPQRPLSFSQGGTSVRVVPDLISFSDDRPPTIFDWKVNNYALRDYWLQLVTGAIALTRCTPHRDWPAGATNHAPHDIRLFEIQLLTGDTKEHTMGPEDVHEAEDLISISADAMQLAVSNNPKTTSPEDLAPAKEPTTCARCNFRQLCWRTTHD